MPRIFILLVFIAINATQAQAQTDTLGKNRVYQFVTNMPEFPGGDEAMQSFLANNIQYPLAARKANLSGRVIVQFIVLANGQITNPQIKKEVGGGCGEEVLRVIKKMPKWKAGMQDGQLVNVQYMLPVMFELEESIAPAATTTKLTPYLNYERTKLVRKYLGVH